MKSNLDMVFQNLTAAQVRRVNQELWRRGFDELPADFAGWLEMFTPAQRGQIMQMLAENSQRFAAARDAYRRGEVSVGKAAEMAGLPRRMFEERARRAGVAPQWNEKMAEEETE